MYCLSGYIRSNASSGLGANLSVSDVYAFSDCVYDSEGEWEQVYLYGRTTEAQHTLTVFARLGGYSGEAVGTASFRDIRLCKVDSVPDNYYIQTLGRTAAASYTTSSSKVGKAAWPWLLAICLGYAVVCLYLSRFISPERDEALQPSGKFSRLTLWAFPMLMLTAFAARIGIAVSVYGYGVDVGDFISWGSMLMQNGAADFYTSGGFCDYPPGYILILGLIANIGRLLGCGTTVLLVKMPSIVCDIAAAALLFFYGRKLLSQKGAFILSALYAFNPLTFVDGSAWGQADSVMAFCILLVVLWALQGKWHFALPMYMAAVLLKPQALMFGPLGLLALVCDLIKSHSKKELLRAGIGLAAAAILGLLIVLPFSVKQTDPLWIIQLYTGTMSYYADATVNACNLYFLFGKNWLEVDASMPVLIRLTGMILLFAGVWFCGFKGKWYHPEKIKLPAVFRMMVLPLGVLLSAIVCILPMTYATYGTCIIVLSVIAVSLLYIAQRNIRHLPLLGGLMLLILCNLGTMMHERYLFPAILLLALAAVVEKDKRVFVLFVLVTCTVFMNVSVVLDRALRVGGVEGHLNAPIFGIASDSALIENLTAAINCLLVTLGMYISCRICVDGQSSWNAAHSAENTTDSIFGNAEDRESQILNRITTRRKPLHMTKWDWILMLVITVLYAVAAFANLGSAKAPQTYWRSTTSDNTVILDLGENKTFNILYYGGIHNIDSDFSVSVSADGINWPGENGADMSVGNCFKWQYVCQSYYYGGSTSYSSTPIAFTGRYVRISADMIGTTLYEFLLRDPETQQVYPVTATENGAALVDEQDTLTGEPGWYNSTYFDEIYHARTGYEHYLAMKGDYTYHPYETSHPPLGKVLMAFSIMIFGMTPFGWRFAGALAGVLMLPAMYLLGRMLFKRRRGAFAACFLMAVDCMHYTQTRIATIDSFVVLFILWSVVCMLYYFRMDYWHAKPIKTLIPLALSGLFMGLSIASKWTGCYNGVGLAMLFFLSIFRRFTEVRAAKKVLSRAETDLPPEITYAATQGYRTILITLISCFAFFIAVPLVIYYASYIPYFLPTGGVSISKIIGAAEGMLSYHSTPGLGMDHPFYSPWYEWPLIIKPMWYYSATYAPDGFRQTIAAFGNPAVWWGGLVGFAVMLVFWLKQHIVHGSFRLHTVEPDSRPLILLICIAAQYLPWMLVPRGTYIYHYFPTVGFIILCTVLMFEYLSDVKALRIKIPSFLIRRSTETLTEETPTPTVSVAAILLILYLCLAFVLFIAFFPYASGVWANTGWLRSMQWFSGWLYY